MGEVWRQEIDLPHLEDTLSDLMQQIRPFYQLLHAVVRNVIGENVRKSFQTISAHLLGETQHIHPFPSEAKRERTSLVRYVVTRLANVPKSGLAI